MQRGNKLIFAEGNSTTKLICTIPISWDMGLLVGPTLWACGQAEQGCGELENCPAVDSLGKEQWPLTWGPGP